MLPVSQLLGAALGSEGPGAAARRAPDRFGQVRAPVVVVWNTCPHCNQRCPHCYAAAVARPTPDTLDTAAGKALLRKLAEGGVRQLILSGGEPLLRDDLEELAAHARHLGLRVHLSSNGTRLSDERARALAEAGVEYAGVSLDGLAAFNDRWRGSHRGFERAVRGLRAAQAAGMRTGVRITVTRHNAGQVMDLLEHVARLGVNRFYVSHLLPSGRAGQLDEVAQTVEERRALLHTLFAWAHAALERGVSTQLVTGGNDADGPLLLRWVEARFGERPAERLRTLLRMRGGNSAGERILCVDHTGRVFPDQFWRSAQVGDLRRQSLAEVLAHPLLAELRTRERRLQGRCGLCRYVALCRGSHRERAEAAHGARWAPDPACSLLDEEIGLPTGQRVLTHREEAG